MGIVTLVASTANHIGVFDTYAFLRRSLTKSQVAILVYHSIRPEDDDLSIYSMRPQSFRRQVEYLCRSCEIISLEKLVEHMNQKTPLPSKAVVITFDDGYKDNYLYAYPILKKHNIPATVFLATGLIGKGKLFWWDKVTFVIRHATVEQLDLNDLGTYSIQSKSERLEAIYIISEKLKGLPDQTKNLIIEDMLSASGVDIPPDLGKELILSWDEVREMSNGCVRFGAHTVNHPMLTNVPLEQASWEISQSKKDIEEKLGRAATAFSYPDGAFNSRIAKSVKESGFTCGVSVSPRKLISPKDNIYELGRVGPSPDFNKFKGCLCGLWGDLQNNVLRAKR